MAPNMVEGYISLKSLLGVSYGMLILTSVFAAARTGIRMARPKIIALDDVLILIAYVIFLAMSIMNIVVAPTLYHVSHEVLGNAIIDSPIENEARSMVKIFLAYTLLLWVCLWMVKASLLALYWKLMGPNQTFLRLWWTVIIFCILAFIGGFVTTFLSCSSMDARFIPGACATTRDHRVQQISIYYSFAVDVLSDLLIMALAIGLTRNLKISKAKKFSIAILFFLGWIEILATIIRVVSASFKSHSDGTPSSTWLALWAVVEAAVAVIIGICPGLYDHACTWVAALDSRGFSEVMKTRSKTASPNPEPYPKAHDKLFNLRSTHVATISCGSSGSMTLWNEGTSSFERSRSDSCDQEEDGRKSSNGWGEIYVTRDFEVRPASEVSLPDNVFLR